MSISNTSHPTTANDRHNAIPPNNVLDTVTIISLHAPARHNKLTREDIMLILCTAWLTSAGIAVALSDRKPAAQGAAAGAFLVLTLAIAYTVGA
jgi:hypothetical protein